MTIPNAQTTYYRVTGKTYVFSTTSRGLALAHDASWKDLDPDRTSDCFKRLGYSIRPLALLNSESGERWSVFRATMNDESLRVMERIHSAGGDQSWTDVSTWYWQAILGKTYSPWWAVTVTERQ